MMGGQVSVSGYIRSFVEPFSFKGVIYYFVILLH